MTIDNGLVILRDVRGLGEQFALLDGVDHDGNVWVFHRLTGGHHCALCGAPITDGWTCFDDSRVVCAKHVSISGKI